MKQYGKIPRNWDTQYINEGVGARLIPPKMTQPRFEHFGRLAPLGLIFSNLKPIKVFFFFFFFDTAKLPRFPRCSFWFRFKKRLAFYAPPPKSNRLVAAGAVAASNVER